MGPYGIYYNGGCGTDSGKAFASSMKAVVTASTFPLFLDLSTSIMHRAAAATVGP